MCDPLYKVVIAYYTELHIEQLLAPGWLPKCWTLASCFFVLLIFGRIRGCEACGTKRNEFCRNQSTKCSAKGTSLSDWMSLPLSDSHTLNDVPFSTWILSLQAILVWKKTETIWVVGASSSVKEPSWFCSDRLPNQSSSFFEHKKCAIASCSSWWCKGGLPAWDGFIWLFEWRKKSISYR